MKKNNLGKPTKETELLRIWEVDKNKKPQCLENEKEGFEVDLGEGMKIKTIGFTEARHKKTKELIFAYKFKHESKFVIYYIPKETDETKMFLEKLKEITSIIGYNLQDLKENMKSMKQEIKLIEDKK